MKTLKNTILCAVAILFSVLAQTAQGKVDVSVIPGMLSAYSSMANTSYKFRINNSELFPADVTIAIYLSEPYHYGYGSSKDTISAARSLRVPPASATELAITVPAVQNTYMIPNRISLYINGKESDSSSLLTSCVLQISSTERCALMSPSLDETKYNVILQNNYNVNAPPIGKVYFKSDLSLKQWSAVPADYINFSQIWINCEDQLPPAVSDAISQWVSAGGTLIKTVEPEQNPVVFNSPRDTDRFATSGFVEKKQGLGRICFYRPINSAALPEFNKILENYRNAPTHEKNTKEITDKTRLLLDKQYIPERGLTLEKQFQMSHLSAMPSLPAPSIPLNALLLVMTVFAVLAGPVNFLILKKHNKQALMIVTVPVISLVFSTAIIVFISLSTGWKTSGTTRGFTYLDQSGKFASTTAYISMLANGGTKKGFNFQQGDNLVFTTAGLNINVLDKPGFSLAPGLLRPRTPLNFMVRKHETRNEKIRFIQNDDSIEMVNGLGIDIAALLYINNEGRIFTIDTTAEQGQRTQLREINKHYQTPRNFNQENLIEAFLNNEIMENSFINAANFLPKNSFAALLNKPLFHTVGYEADELECKHLVFGPAE